MGGRGPVWTAGHVEAWRVGAANVEAVVGWRFKAGTGGVRRSWIGASGTGRARYVETSCGGRGGRVFSGRVVTSSVGARPGGLRLACHGWAWAVEVGLVEARRSGAVLDRRVWSGRG